MLKRLFRWLWCPGPCKWTIYAQGNIMSGSANVGRFYHLRCETCGTMKHKSFEQ